MKTMPPGTALTRIVGSPVLGQAGERLGKVRDVVARLREGRHPVVTGLVMGIGGRDVFVPMGEAADIGAGEVRLSVDRLDLRSFERRPLEILLGADILGRHVINLVAARLVRVRDIELGDFDGELCVRGIDVGSGAMFERLAARLARSSRPLAFLDWSSIEPFLNHVPTVRRRLPFARLARLHPAELADIVESASPAEGEEIMRAVGEDRDLEADVFEELDTDYQVELIRSRPDEEAAEILANMSPDDATDLLLEIDGERRERLLARLPLVQLRKVRMLLGYNSETAGGLMSPDILALPCHTSVEDAIDVVRANTVPGQSAETLFVVDGAGTLAGSLSVVDLLRHDGDLPLDAVATRNPVVVQTHADIPEVALKMADFNLHVLPVVDGELRPIGVVTVDDLLEVVLPTEWRVRVQHYPPVQGGDASPLDDG